jgi:hypothetical protein
LIKISVSFQIALAAETHVDDDDDSSGDGGGGDDDDDNNNNNNSVLYFNVLTQQLQESITESAQDNNKRTKTCL